MTKIKNELINYGLKPTKHRMEIMNLLSDLHEPVSAEEIYNNLIKKDVSINLSTVYRTLETLEDKNIIRTVILNGTDKTLFELNGHEHKHYFVCITCKKMLPIMHCPLEAYEQRLTNEKGFEVTGHRLEIFGYCNKCRQNLHKD
ncbi:MAG TPA: Fur family transcriptional regulator [Clostridia bacterium]